MSVATTTVMSSSTICIGSSPSSRSPSSQIDATAMVGMVRPIEAIEEPKARLRLTCTRSRAALSAAAMDSGASTSSAMTTPTTA